MGENTRKINLSQWTCVVSNSNNNALKESVANWTLSGEAKKNMKQAVVFNFIGMVVTSWVTFSTLISVYLALPIIVSILIALLPWCWGIPATVHIIKKIKEERLPIKGFMIFNLFLVSVIGGLLLLLAEDEFYKNH